MKNDSLLKSLAIALFAMLILSLILNQSRKRWKEEAEEQARRRERANQLNAELAYQNQYLRQQLHRIQGDLVFLKESVKSGESIEVSVLAKLDELVRIYASIDEKVSGELLSTMNLLAANEPVKATFSMVKVVETLLKEKYQDDPVLMAIHGRTPSFANYLDHALNQGLFEKEEYSFARGLKEIRNQEGHELDVKKDRNLLQTAMLAGIFLIMKLKTA